jgi:dipeptidase E
VTEESGVVELLLLSNSTNHGRRRLEHVRTELAEFYGDREVLFVPYALADHDAYTAAIGDAFAAAGVALRGVHTTADPRAALAEAQAVFVGGGNTFRLLRALRRGGLLDAIRDAVARGARYGGASAGTNVACPTIRTTNDMPIVEPTGFAALGLVDFQINPHYLDAAPDSRHMGETRAERIAEFLECNDVPVLGLREGAWLRVSPSAILLRGRDAALFRRDTDPIELGADTDISTTLTSTPRRFDAPS